MGSKVVVHAVCKRRSRHRASENMAEKSQKVVLITGCSSGIGLSTAILLAKDPERRFKVYASLRNLSKRVALAEEGNDVLGHTLFIEKLDVSVEEEIYQIVDDIIKKEGKIDVLVNNAGIGCRRLAELDTFDNIKPIFAINTFGPMVLTKALLPHWKQRNSGHAVLISSISGIIGSSLNCAYCASKFAVEGYYEGLAQECMDFNIKFSIIEPGPVRSKFQENIPTHDTNDYNKVDAMSKQFMKTMVNKWDKILSSKLQSSEEIAQWILEAITAERPNFRYVTNKAMIPTVQAKYCDINGNAGINAMKKMFESKAL